MYAQFGEIKQLPTINSGTQPENRLWTFKLKMKETKQYLCGGPGKSSVLVHQEYQ